jgi:hypothetical protein
MSYSRSQESDREEHKYPPSWNMLSSWQSPLEPSIASTQRLYITFQRLTMNRQVVNLYFVSGT